MHGLKSSSIKGTPTSSDTIEAVHCIKSAWHLTNGGQMLTELKNFLSKEQVESLFDDSVQCLHRPDTGIFYFELDNPIGVELGVDKRKYYAAPNVNLLDQRIREYYKREFGKDISCRRGARLITYREGINCPWHNDFVTRGPQRECSAILFLSDTESYTGGQLQFKNHADPESEQGDLLVYSSDEVHGVTTVESGIRKVLVLFYHED